LRHLLRPWPEHGVGRRSLRMVLLFEQRHQPAVADRPRHHVVGEPGDAGAVQGQLQDAFLTVAGEYAGDLHMLYAAVGGAEGPAAAARRRETDAAMLSQALATLGRAELLKIARTCADPPPHLADLPRHQT